MWLGECLQVASARGTGAYGLGIDKDATLPLPGVLRALLREGLRLVDEGVGTAT